MTSKQSLGATLLLGVFYHLPFFSLAFNTGSHRDATLWASSRRLTQMRMVRNIDFPEALIFYDTTSSSSSILLEDDGETIRSGISDLLQECKDVSTPAIFISTSNDKQPPSELASYLTVFPEIDNAPPTKSLWESIHSLTIQPEGFGGSSGFGRKLADPERSPLPKYTVVFCADLEVCRAARAVGMRVLCFEDNDLADAIIDDYYNLYLEDVATPGSFWLNPPYPRDDEGNKVDVSSLVEAVEEEDEEDGGDADNGGSDIEEAKIEEDEELSDDALQAILNDMDPL